MISDANGNGNGHGRTYSHFAALNRFVDGGWLASLTAIESGLWVCLHRHADKDGNSFPSNSLLMDELGHRSASHIQKAKRQLLKLGLLEIVGTGGGRERCQYRLLMPPIRHSPVAESATGSGIGEGSESAGAPVADSATAGVAESATSPVAESAAPYKEEQHNGTSHSTTQSPSHSVSEKIVEEIFRSYPRQEARPKALNAIREHIAVISRRPEVENAANWLRSKVLAYAAVRKRIIERNRTQAKYTPRIENWLGDEHYDDNPEVWERDGGNDEEGDGELSFERRDLTPAEYADIMDIDLQGREPTWESVQQASEQKWRAMSPEQRDRKRLESPGQYPSEEQVAAGITIVQFANQKQKEDLNVRVIG